MQLAREAAPASGAVGSGLRGGGSGRRAEGETGARSVLKEIEESNDQPKVTMLATTNTHFKSAIESCLACAVACDQCVDAILNDESATERGESIRKCLDCAAICRTTATLLSRGSSIATDLCRVCIEACLRCETECKNGGDEACAECAKQCEACEDALRSIS